MSSASTGLRIGAHVDQTDPIAEAAARGATLAQFFLGDPQGYKGPEVRYAGGAAALRAAAEQADLDLYVHAPYLVNVATSNNKIRIPSRKLLSQHAGLRHKLEKKPSKITRRLTGTKAISAADAPRVKKLLGR